MALPWGQHACSSSNAVATGDVEIALLPCGGGASASSMADRIGRMLFGRAPAPLPSLDGAIVAPAGLAYEIQVTLHERTSAQGALRIVRATIDGEEVNEQLVLRDSSLSARFVGWLEDGTGAKRLHFTFPANDRESFITIGVFEATEVGAPGKQRATPSPPTSATGASFQGPTVGSARYTLGRPIAMGSARLRAGQPD